MNKYSKAFTLVELAIVIVIIGLLVGGVLQGQELIKQAKARTLMKSVEDYKSAITTFKAKYNCLPGDCPNAYVFFASKNCGANSVVSSSNTMGCNGDGNGVLSYAEGLILWSHLSFANVVKGSFTTGYKSAVQVGVDLPAVPVDDSVGIYAQFAQGDATNVNSCGYASCIDAGPENILGYMVGKNVFGIGNVRPNVNWNGANGAFMTPLEALEFDTKFDDGIVFKGSISGFKGRLSDGSPGSCANNLPPTALYSTTAYKDDQCMMVFDAGF